MGAYDALKEKGLTIPDQVAVVGFDNREVIAAHMRPPLTTVALPYFEMGYWAVEYLLGTSGRPEPSTRPTCRALPARVEVFSLSVSTCNFAVANATGECLVPVTLLPGAMSAFRHSTRSQTEEKCHETAVTSSVAGT